MSSYTCPFCSAIIPETYATTRSVEYSFEQFEINKINLKREKTNFIKNYFIKCPNCQHDIIFIIGTGGDIKGKIFNILPNSLAKQYPDYIPKSIREDYEEACSIVNLSPKASATLSRRCLQSMIRDFWQISKNCLVNEIEELENHIPPTQKNVLHSLRNIGNIGAHPEKDVNTIIDIIPEDADKLIKIIEFFIEHWYVEKHQEEELFNYVNNKSECIKQQRNNSNS